MLGEPIDKIKKTEENAKISIKEAQAESDKMSRDARGKAEAIIEEARKQAVEEKKLLIKKAEEEAAAEVAKLREENEVAKKEIRATAESNRPKAASFIIRRVVG